MSRLFNCVVRERRLVLAVGSAALIVVATALPDRARADNSAVEPEVGASATLPGMPPAPFGAPPIPQAKAPAPSTAVASSPSKAPAKPASAPIYAASRRAPAEKQVTIAKEPATGAMAAKEAPRVKDAVTVRNATAANEAMPLRDVPSRREAMAALEASRTESGAPPWSAPSAQEARPEPARPMAQLGGNPTLAIVSWSIGGDRERNDSGEAPVVARAGQPLYLRLTIQGGKVALDRLLATGSIPIVVHWTRGDGAASGALDRTSELTIGHRGVGSGLAGEVEHTGHFEWHTWTSNSTLSPGQWNVSLTYPDGQPLACGSGSDVHPCRFSIDIG